MISLDLKASTLAITVALLLPVAAMAQPPAAPAGAPGPGGPNPFAAMMAKRMAMIAEAKKAPTPRTADGKPDLNGVWGEQGMALGPGTVKDGNVVFAFGDYGPGGRRPMPADGPKYKPEFVAKVDYNDANEPVTDNVFNCGRAGTPRMGAPMQIVQTPKQVVLLYTEVAGESFRVVPTDGRGFRPRVDASLDGDSIGHWDGDTLVIDSQNYVEETWFGERGYLHTDQMKVQERIKREGDTLTWTATVTDPAVLLQPWTTQRTVLLSNQALEEPPPCHDIVSDHLVNHDNHQQR